jgi:hypothetical protein
MFSGLGTNVAASILAAVATVFAFTPFLFMRYGEKLRERSKVACDNGEAMIEENKHLEGRSEETDEKGHV